MLIIIRAPPQDIEFPDAESAMQDGDESSVVNWLRPVLDQVWRGLTRRKQSRRAWARQETAR